MTYNQFQYDLLKIPSRNLQTSGLADLIVVAILTVVICQIIIKINKSKKQQGNSNLLGFTVIVNMISIIFVVVGLVGFLSVEYKNYSEEQKFISSFIDDTSNFKWKKKKIEKIVPFPSNEGMDELVYLKISNDIYGYNSEKNNEIKYQEDENEKTSNYDGMPPFFFVFGSDKIYNYERSIYWSTDTKKVNDIPSKVSYEYKLKEDKFYKNKDKLPREFWRRIENNPKEKIVFYIPKSGSGVRK